MTPGAAPQTAFEAALQLAAVFRDRGISYAIGGALAYGQHVVPRATNDVDINIFVKMDGLEKVFAALATLGVACDPERDRAAARAEGMFIAHLGGFRLDLFVPSIAFAWEAEATRVQQNIDGVPVYFLSPEALCVFKLMFFRAKDVADLERTIAFLGPRLDVSYVRGQVATMMGEDDERVVAWDHLLQSLP